MSADIASVDEESLRSDLRELVRKTVQETLNALLDEEADEMVGAEALREDGRPRGVPLRPLQEEAGHHERRGRARRPQASRRHLPDRRHRALPQTGDGRRGGNHRDVPGGRFHAPHRGRLRDPMGRGRLGRNRVEPQREGVRKRGCLADQAAFRRLPVPVRRRHIPEAKLGRVLRERRGDGRHRREPGGPPRDRGLRRGARRAQGILEGVPAVAARARAVGREARRRR